MLKRRTLMASATALPLTSVIPAAWAATPKDTLVFASQIDGLITFDPGEAYEIAAQIIASSICDRLVRYEAEDVRMSDNGVENVFLRLRWPDTDGRPVCPGCGCTICNACPRSTTGPRWRCKGAAVISPSPRVPCSPSTSCH